MSDARPVGSCADGEYLYVATEFVRDRKRVRRSTNRVKRGGSWNNNANNVRAAQRNNNTPTNRNNNIGFRVVNPQRIPEKR